MDLPTWAPPPGADGMWGLKELPAVAGVTPAAVHKWRSMPPPMGLPEPDRLAPGRRYPTPRWSPERVLRWLAQTGRLDEHLRPVRPPQSGGHATGADQTSRSARILLLQQAERDGLLTYHRLVAKPGRGGVNDRFVVTAAGDRLELPGDQVEAWLKGFRHSAKGRC